MRKPALLLILFLLVPIVAQSQTSRRISLDACVELALSENRRLKAARAEAQASEATRTEARAGMLPSLSVSGSFLQLSPNIPDYKVEFPAELQPLFGAGSIEIAPAIRERYEGMIHVRQPLFTGGLLRNQLKQASRSAEAARYRARDLEMRVAFAVRQAYWTLYEALSIRKVADAALLQVESHLADVEKLRQEGMTLESDVLNVKTRRAEVQLQVIEADNMIRTARLELNHLLGLPLTEEIEPTDVPDPGPHAMTDEVNLFSRSDVAAQSAQVAAAESAVRVAESAWFPKVSLAWDYLYARPNQNILPLEESFSGTWAAGVNVTMDLWNWGRTSAQTRRAKAYANQAAWNLRDTEQLAAVEIQQSLFEIERAGAVLDVAKQGESAARSSYENLTNRYAQGAALNSEVLDAERALREAETRRVSAEASIAVAHAAWLLSTGRILDGHE